MKKLMMTVGMAAMLGMATLALAQRPPKDAKLPKEIQGMYRLVGKWEGKAALQMGESKSVLSLSWTCEPASLPFVSPSRGYGVACKARFTGMPGGAQRAPEDHQRAPEGHRALAQKVFYVALSNPCPTRITLKCFSMGGEVKAQLSRASEIVVLISGVHVTVRRVGTGQI